MVPHLGVSFAKGLRALGHTVQIVDQRWAYTPLDRKPLRPLRDALLGPGPSGSGIFRYLLLRAGRSFCPDLILATSASALDVETLHEVRAATRARLAVFLSDSPFNPVVSFPKAVTSLAAWDLVASPRRASLWKVREHTSGAVMYLPFAYDPTIHYREVPQEPRDVENFTSDVVFLGGCDPDRIPYLDALARSSEISVTLYGGNYPGTSALRSVSRKPVYGRNYRLALSGTKVAPCLVRRANQDGHVMRTFEVPACNSFLLAERTDEHAELFREDREAVFFETPDELVDKARYYVRNAKAREEIASRGGRKILENPNTYADRLKMLLAQCAKL